MPQRERRELPLKELAQHAGLHRLPGTREMLALLPGIAAGAVALLYTVGALLWVAELQGIPVSVVDVLPLIPLEQILSRGIGTLVLIGIIAAISAPLLVAAPWLESQIDDRIDKLRPQDQADRRARRKTLAAYRRKLHTARMVTVVALVAIALLMPPVVTCGVLLLQAATFYVTPRYEPPSLRAVITVVGLYVLLVAMVDAFASPRARPEANLTLDNGRTLHGALITATSTTWYLAPKAERVEAVDVREIDEATLATPQRDRDSTLDVIGLGGLDPF